MSAATELKLFVAGWYIFFSGLLINFLLFCCARPQMDDLLDCLTDGLDESDDLCKNAAEVCKYCGQKPERLSDIFVSSLGVQSGIPLIPFFVALCMACRSHYEMNTYIHGGLIYFSVMSCIFGYIYQGLVGYRLDVLGLSDKCQQSSHLEQHLKCEQVPNSQLWWFRFFGIGIPVVGFVIMLLALLKDKGPDCCFFLTKIVF